MRTTVMVVAAVMLLAACGVRSGGAPQERRTAAALTTEEIRASTASNVYDMVQSVRPMWLRLRGNTSLQEPEAILVYVNRLRTGGVETLRQLRPDAVESMRFLDGVAATARYGVGHSNGVIDVTLIAGH